MSFVNDLNQLKGENLTCERGGRTLFTELNFSLESGQSMIIQGENGAGKTSLLRIITGLSQPEEGKVLWNDENIEDIAEQFQANLQYIGHLSAVKRELTVRENLKLIMRLWPSDSSLSIPELAELVGLRKRLSVTCSRLSAGQLRRVSLARLFISVQKLWILDEPLTALDVGFISTIEERLQQHLQTGGIVILTTHRGIDLGNQETTYLTI